MNTIYERVKIRTFSGEIVERCVVDRANGRVYVASLSEIESAAREEREPLILGFPLADVVKNTDDAE